MKPRLYACLAGLCVLAACAERANGPVGAPIPSHPEMTFVDADGCSWWVIGNATSYSWARHTNSKGEHVCSEESELPAVANNGVPFVTEDSPEPKVATTLAGSSARFVQVATFAERANAVAAADRFAKLNLPVRPSSTSIGPDGFYRLVLGPFVDPESTDTALATAQTEGFVDAFKYMR